jgi:hypothetical protein
MVARAEVIQLVDKASLGQCSCGLWTLLLLCRRSDSDGSIAEWAVVEMLEWEPGRDPENAWAEARAEDAFGSEIAARAEFESRSESS